jgi:hypothetical protein
MIQEDARRGTSINAAIDQASLLRYWAWVRQSVAVGIALPIDNHTVEYWMDFMLDPVPDDDGRVYAEIFRQPIPTDSCHMRQSCTEFQL